MTFEQALLVAAISAALALIFNSLIQLLKAYFDSNINKSTFKREQSLERLKGLYIEIYKIIIQSEYIRYFNNKYELNNLDPIDFPFLEISMSSKSIKFNNGKLSEEVVEVENEITQEKKRKIISSILDNPHFASVELLKLATAYRYVYHYFEKDNLLEKVRTNIDEEEIRLSRMLIMTIIKETNELLETCNQTIDGKEISYGLFNHDIFERDRL